MRLLATLTIAASAMLAAPKIVSAQVPTTDSAVGTGTTTSSIKFNRMRAAVR